jgi:hypothetical protein
MFPWKSFHTWSINGLPITFLVIPPLWLYSDSWSPWNIERQSKPLKTFKNCNHKFKGLNFWKQNFRIHRIKIRYGWIIKHQLWRNLSHCSVASEAHIIHTYTHIYIQTDKHKEMAFLKPALAFMNAGGIYIRQDFEIDFLRSQHLPSLHTRIWESTEIVIGLPRGERALSGNNQPRIFSIQFLCNKCSVIIHCLSSIFLSRFYILY